MKKKLDTRFPAARIKKIMQADEDIGKIAMAVPLLVSKALELFLQDLCDRTYEITLQRGVKTLNSLHLKQCVHSFNVFDFLKDVVSRVPNLGGSDAVGEDGSATKRRKTADDEDNTSDDELKMSRMEMSFGSEFQMEEYNSDGLSAMPPNIDTSHTNSSRGRGRGRGRSRGGRTIERDSTNYYEKFEDSLDISTEDDEKHKQSRESLDNVLEPDRCKGNVLTVKNEVVPVRDFDLNVELDENGDSTARRPATPVGSSTKHAFEMKHEEYAGWSLADMERMAIDPIQLANFSRRIEEEEEDYDEED